MPGKFLSNGVKTFQRGKILAILPKQVMKKAKIIRASFSTVEASKANCNEMFGDVCTDVSFAICTSIIREKKTKTEKKLITDLAILKM